MCDYGVEMLSTHREENQIFAGREIENNEDPSPNSVNCLCS